MTPELLAHNISIDGRTPTPTGRISWGIPESMRSETPLPDERWSWVKRSPCPTCPSWVVRCSHLDGQTVYIVDVKMLRGQTQTQGWGDYEVHGPTVINVESENPEVRRHGLPGNEDNGCVPDLTSNREEADEFFTKRDEHLRRGGCDDECLETTITTML